MAIYFIRSSADGPIKIGYAKDVAARIAGIQTGCPDPIELLGAMDGTHRDEQSLHRKFERRRGEWFEPTPTLLAFIASLPPHSIELRRLRPPRRKPSGTRGQARAKRREIETMLNTSIPPILARSDLDQLEFLTGIPKRTLRGMAGGEHLPSFTRAFQLADFIPELRELFTSLLQPTGSLS